MRRRVPMVIAALACATAVLPAPRASAQEASMTGAWAGVLQVSGMEFELVFHVVEGEDGSLSTTLDSVSQGVTGIVCAETVVEGTELHVSGCEIPGGGGYDGTLTDEGGLTGTFNQAGQSFPLDLSRSEGEDA